METQLSETSALLIVIGLTLVFAIIGLVLILLHSRNKRKAEESLSWPETVGRVSESGVAQTSSMSMSDEPGEPSTPVYLPEISYIYQVAGAEYTSNRLAFASKKSFSKREKAEEVASLYPVGRQLTVYYDAMNPKEAVVDRTAKRSNTVLIFGIAFLILGTVTLLIGILLIF